MKEQTRWTPKRLLSLLLALVMLLGVMPTAVFAAEVGNGETYYFDPTITGAKTITFNRKLIIVQPIGEMRRRVGKLLTGVFLGVLLMVPIQAGT